MLRGKCHSLIVLITVLIGLALVLAGCSRISVGTDRDGPEETPEIKKTKTPVPEEPPMPTPNPMLTADQVLEFLRENHPDENMLDCFIEDFDRDGFEEAMVVVGDSQDSISGFYILRYRNGILEQVDELAGNDNGYSILNIEPVHMDGTDEIFINVELTNWVSLYGFAFYEIEGDGILQLFISASPTGAGEDGLLDLDDDGVYDGFYQNRWSYDVFYYPTYRQYLWLDGIMVPDICSIDLPDYPGSIEKTILEYFVLSMLDLENCPEADERLYLLFPGDDSGFSPHDLYSAVCNEILELDDGLDFAISQDGDSAIARVSGADAYGEVHEYTFRMVKKDYGWSIESMD